VGRFESGVPVLPPEIFFENIDANLCDWCILGTSGHRMWDGKSTLIRPIIKLGRDPPSLYDLP